MTPDPPQDVGCELLLNVTGERRFRMFSRTVPLLSLMLLAFISGCGAATTNYSSIPAAAPPSDPMNNPNAKLATEAANSSPSPVMATPSTLMPSR